MAAPGFWDNLDDAQKIARERNHAEEKVLRIERLFEECEEFQILLEVALEEDDESIGPEIESQMNSFRKKLDKMELSLLLGEKYDGRNAILSIHPGAGGTESQDWAEILLRMYTRWAEEQGYEVEIVDMLPGEEAGVKSATLTISGPYAYGYLKGEKGVHRLVRISPFDSSSRRHTSFTSVDVMPEIDDDIEVDIDPDDLRIETYRSGGAGGQHVNKTDSAVRIVHIPTGIVVQCQNERSQHKNKATAMKLLRAKLFDRNREEQEKKMAALKGEVKEIAWGNQIRSYVFHPYNMVKDHRTGVEIGNIQAVVDGWLEPFIEAYLHMMSNPAAFSGK
jgi:peptide chain release factor 2